MSGYSRQYAIHHYYIEKAYKTWWGQHVVVALSGFECDFLDIKPMTVMTNDLELV
jgi:hypothetical protein